MQQELGLDDTIALKLFPMYSNKIKDIIYYSVYFH